VYGFSLTQLVAAARNGCYFGGQPLVTAGLSALLLARRSLLEHDKDTIIIGKHKVFTFIGLNLVFYIASPLSLQHESTSR
jgi:hypothetical protein